MSYLDRIQSTHLDTLKEIGNIGAGHAATALSTLLNKKIDMLVPNVQILHFDDVMEMAGGSDNIVASVFLRIEGDIAGSMYFVLQLEQAALFIRKLTGDESFSFDRPPYSEMALSALQEVGNILSGSYLSALGDFTGLHLSPSVPALAIDMVGAVMSDGLFEVSQYSDYAIFIDTTLKEANGKTSDTVKGHFFLLPDPNSFWKVFDALGVPIDE
jgi:chemotaxis protein CheC